MRCWDSRIDSIRLFLFSALVSRRDVTTNQKNESCNKMKTCFRQREREIEEQEESSVGSEWSAVR